MTPRSRFLSQLRSRMPSGLIFTNQGYRSAQHYLPYVDWDLTESLMNGAGRRLLPASLVERSGQAVE